MYKCLVSLLIAFVVTGVLAVVSPAQAQVSIRIGPPPSPFHFWVPERRVWNGRRYMRTPGRWERRQARREQRREQWREQRRERRQEQRRWDRR